MSPVREKFPFGASVPGVGLSDLIDIYGLLGKEGLEKAAHSVGFKRREKEEQNGRDRKNQQRSALSGSIETRSKPLQAPLFDDRAPWGSFLAGHPQRKEKRGFSQRPCSPLV